MANMTPHPNADKFAEYVRNNLYGGKLAQSQYEGIRYILREWRGRFDFGGDHRHLAYMLATAHHETAFTMVPVTEYGSQSYLRSKKYYPYIGRGHVQLTWDYNYEKAGKKIGLDLINDPEQALVPDISAKIMFEGMAAGWFTGKSLSDYFNAKVDDPVNARRIINGTDKASTIAGYHKHWLKAIKLTVEPA
jgi:predicted chitinase